MKVTTATVHFKQRTQKTLADGTHPIMLVVQWQGRKEQATGISCTEEQWDSTNECFKKRMPNYVQLNKLLISLKNEVIQRKLYYEQTSTPYTAAMLLEKKDLDGTTLRLNDICSQMVKERRLSLKRKLSIDTAYNKICEFMDKDDIVITELTDIKLIDYMKWLDSRIANNTIFNYVSTLYSVIQYAYDADIINKFPKKAKEYFKKKYHREIHHKALPEENIDKLIWYWNELRCNGTDMYSRYSKGFPLTVYLISYAMFGLAPIDILKLRQNQLSQVEVKGSPYYRIDTNRSKTNRNVRVFVNADIYGDMIQPFISEEREYFLPILNSDMDEKRILQESVNLNGMVNAKLADIAEELEIEKFTWYSARHSFASIQVHNNANLGMIATAMGRSITGITSYIKNLSTDEDLISLT